MELFRWEIKKIGRRNSTKAVVLIAVAYVLFSTVYNAVVNLGSPRDEGYGTNPDGIRRIAEQYDYAESYKGDMTEEKLLEIYERVQGAYVDENNVIFPDGGRGTDENIKPIQAPANMLMSLCRITPGFESVYSLQDIPKTVAENYYDIREQTTENLIFSQVSDEQDRAFFRNQNAQVKTPFYYDWSEGQRMYLEILSPIPVIVALLIAIFLSPVCAMEYQQKTDRILLCAKYGRKKLAWAKLSASVAFSTAVYLLCIGLYVAGQLIFCGTRALNCPIQLIKPLATAPLTILQAEIYLIVLGYFSCLAMAAVTFLLSSMINYVFPAVSASMMLIILPMLPSGMLPESLRFLSVLPFMSNYTELFRTNIYFHIWSPYLMLAVPIVIFLLCAPLGVYKFRTHQVAK